MRHLVIGGDSVIGAALSATLMKADETVIATTRRADHARGSRLFFLDLARVDTATLPRADVVYLVAALARLRQCRDDPAGSRQINVVAMETLAQHYSSRGAFVVLLSTDKVFDGSRPLFLPTDPVNPMTVYGQQKAEAEQAVLACGARGAVLRLSKVIQPQDALFSGWIAALRAGQRIRAFEDLFLAPIALATVVDGIRALSGNAAGGIWHLTGKKDVDYAAAGSHIAEQLGAPQTLVMRANAAAAGVSLEERPRYTALDSRRLEEGLGVRIGECWMELDRGLGLA